MGKRFLISWIVLFVVWMLGSFVIHGVLLGDDYAKLTNLFRSPDGFAEVLSADAARARAPGGRVRVDLRARRRSDAVAAAGRALRRAVAVLTVVPTYLIYYVVQPMPGMLVAKQIVFDGVLLVVLGIVAAFMNRAPEAAVRA